MYLRDFFSAKIKFWRGYLYLGLSFSVSIAISQSSGSCQGFVRNLSGRRQAVIKESSGSHK